MCFITFSIPLIGGFGFEGVAVAVLLSIVVRASFTVWIAQAKLQIPLAPALLRASTRSC